MTYYFAVTITTIIFCILCYGINIFIGSKYYIGRNDGEIREGTFFFGADESPFYIAIKNPFIAKRYIANFIYRNKGSHNTEIIREMLYRPSTFVYIVILIFTIHSIILSLGSIQHRDWLLLISLTAFMQLINFFMLNKFIKETLPVVTIFYFMRKKKLSQNNINRMFNIVFYHNDNRTYCMLDKFIFLFYHAKDETLLLSLIKKLKKYEQPLHLALSLWAFKKQASPFSLLCDASMKEYQDDLIYISSKSYSEIMQDCTRDCRGSFILKDVLTSSKH